MPAWNTGNSHLQEEFEDTKGAIRIHKLKRTDNTMTKKRTKKTNNDLQNITHTTKD